MGSRARTVEKQLRLALEVTTSIHLYVRKYDFLILKKCLPILQSRESFYVRKRYMESSKISPLKFSVLVGEFGNNLCPINIMVKCRVLNLSP